MTSKPTLAVASVVAAHGIRGAVKVHLHDPESESLALGRTVQLGADGRYAKIIESSRVPGKNIVRLQLSGVGDRDQAEALRGVELHVERASLPPLAEDEFYLEDAIGLAVERAGASPSLGVVVGLTSNGVQDLFEVEWSGADGHIHEWLLPVLPQFIEDIDERRLLVRLPIGLLPAALELDEAP
ncbi:MAG: 16S rRNA processing protein RimM [Nannocystis sp.]|nr:16S rRNA processing protein RimM [Nannocystis sp.]